MVCDEVLAQVWLSRVRMKGSRRRELLGDPAAILAEYGRDRRAIDLSEVRRFYDRCQSGGISVLLPSDALYERVFGSYRRLGFDVPFLLYGRGDLSLLEKPGIAVVGSREATPYARRVTRELVCALRGLDVTIVSGGASGVDTVAHEAALAADLGTICVLGCGIGYDYPPSNRRLFESLGREHLMLSEYPPGSAPRRHQFPERNRIIAQLSRAVAVTSAGESSGSLITAERAMELDHPVFTVPWPLFQPLGEGCNFLLETGATILTSGNNFRDHLMGSHLICEADLMRSEGMSQSQG